MTAERLTAENVALKLTGGRAMWWRPMVLNASGIGSRPRLVRVHVDEFLENGMARVRYDNRPWGTIAHTLVLRADLFEEGDGPTP